MTWKQEKLMAQLDTVESLGDLVTVSGGLAWHLLSPPHIENKTVHDHSDIDLFASSNEVFPKLKELGFNRYWTKYATENFYRYGRTATVNDKRVKVLIDLFIGQVPFIRVGQYGCAEEPPYLRMRSFKVVEPSYLLTLYETTHSSKNCTAVKNATILLKKGISPVGRVELIGKENR
jgi:hypothetical protein